MWNGGLLKKHALSLTEGFASGVLGLRRSGFAQAGRPFVVLTYYEYAPRANAPAALPVEGRVLARLGWAGQTTSPPPPRGHAF